jgi:Rnl2 family RNA ligase
MSIDQIRRRLITRWASYEKIAESPDQWHLDDADYRALKKIPWVVTEKIHGAHFCILTDGSTISGASRKRLLTPEDTFFAHQRILHRLEPHIFQLFHLVRSLHPQLSWLFLYGELFGGTYPHPDVAPIAGLEPVQTGISYTPDIAFCIFDLAISGIQLPHRYLDYDQAITLLQRTGLLYAPPLLIGSYQESLSHPVEFPSTLPALLGLPPLTQDNKAEGIVIKPLRAILTPQGSIRPMFKRKIPAFAEDKRFHQAQKWLLPSSLQNADNLDLLTWEAFNQLTENRLRSAISKIGYRGFRTRSKSRQLFQLFIADILEQIETNQPARFLHQYSLIFPKSMQEKKGCRICLA